MTGAPTYELLGLHVRSEVPLHATVSDATPDLDVVWNGTTSREELESLPSGRIVAACAVGDHRQYTIAATDGGWQVRVHRVCDFDVSADCRTVTCHLATGGDAGLVAVLVTGLLVAFVQQLRGHCVLHGSAVSVDGLGVGFVGASGMGKSTLAAQFCAAGASLVTDDVLPLVIGDDVVVAGRGAELRLRDKARDLAAAFNDADVRTTADARLAVRPSQAPGNPALAALVVPLPTRTSEHLEVERLTGAAAMMELQRYPRILGLQDRRLLARHFEQVADVAERVAVFRARVPWGPPFSPDTPSQLMAAITPSIGRRSPGTA